VTGGQTPQRPYLYRALHEWMTDNGHTPHIVVDARDKSTIVPVEFVEDGRIVLNVSYAATKNLVLGNDAVTFQARFGGNPFDVWVPAAAVVAIYARETGEGMVFAENPEAGEATLAAHSDSRDDSDGDVVGDATTAEGESDRPGKSDRSHLRVIK